MSKLKILFVTPNFLPNLGGTEIVVYELAKRLSLSGNEVEIFYGSGCYNTSASEEGISLLEELLNLGVRVYTYQSLPLRKFIFNRSFPDLFRKVNKRYDIIHLFHHFQLGWQTALPCRCKKIPLITSLMGGDTYDPTNPPAYEIINRIHFPLVCKLSKKLTAPSLHTAYIASRLLRDVLRKTVIIPHGVDLTLFNCNYDKNKVRSELNLVDYEIIFYTVQRLVKRKKPEFVIYAFKKFLEETHVKDSLLIIIGDGPYYEVLNKLVEKYKLKQNVKLCGFLSRKLLVKYAMASDIFIFHSLHEHFGLAVLEAMALGKPVICTKVGALPELVTNHVNGLLVKPRDVDRFVNAMIELVENQDLCRKIAKNNARKASKYTWDKIMLQYTKIYTSLINSQ